MNEQRILKNLNLSSSTDDSDKDLFKKSDALKQTSTKGSGAEVIYFNIKQKRRPLNEPFDNEFVTDGGLKEKYSKYCNSARVNNFLSTRCKSATNKFKETINHESIPNNDNHSLDTDQNNILIVKNFSSERAIKPDTNVKINNFMKTTAAKRTKSNDQDKPWIWTPKHDPIDDAMKSTLRKKYQVPQPLPKSPPQPEKVEDPVVLTEEEKAECIGRFVHNYEEILKYESQREVMKKTMTIDRKLQRKLRVLKEKGILDKILSDDEDDTIPEDVDKDVSKASNKITFGKKMQRSSNNSQSVPNKPRIDTLELINLIRSERHKIQAEFSDRLYTEKNNNSFRKSASVNNKTSTFAVQSQRIDNEYTFANKKNIRDKNEIYEFMFIKKQQEKEKAITLQQEQLNNDAKKFIEYANVSESQRLIMEELAKKKRNKLIKEEKNKVKNTYWVGQNMFVINDEKDKEEFYKAVMERKRLMSMRKAKSIGPRPKWRDVEIPEDNIYRRKAEEKRMKMSMTQSIMRPKLELKTQSNFAKTTRPEAKTMSKEEFMKLLNYTTKRSLDSFNAREDNTIRNNKDSHKDSITRSKGEILIKNEESPQVEKISEINIPVNDYRIESIESVKKSIPMDSHRIDSESNENIIKRPDSPNYQNSKGTDSINIHISKVTEELERSLSKSIIKTAKNDESVHIEDINMYNRGHIEPEYVEHLVDLITYVSNRRTFYDFFMAMQLKDVEDRLDYLFGTISFIVKANVFADVYNYGVIMANEQVELYNQAFNCFDDIYANHEFENAQNAFEMLKNFAKAKKDQSINIEESIEEIKNESKSSSFLKNKGYSYIYEPISSRESSISVRPNSVDSPKLSRIIELINRQKEERSIRESMDEIEEEEHQEEIYDLNYGEQYDEKQVNCSKLSNYEINKSHITDNKPESRSLDLDSQKRTLSDPDINRFIPKNKIILNEQPQRVHAAHKTEPLEERLNNNIKIDISNNEIEESIEADVIVTPDKKIEIKYTKTDEDQSAKNEGSDIEWFTISNSKSLSNTDLKYKDDKDKLVEIIEEHEKDTDNVVNTSNNLYDDFEDVDVEDNNDDIVKIVTEEIPDNNIINQTKSRNNFDLKGNDEQIVQINEEIINQEDIKKQELEDNINAIKNEDFENKEEQIKFEVSDRSDEVNDDKLIKEEIVSSFSEIDEEIVIDNFSEKLQLVDTDQLAEELTNLILEEFFCNNIKNENLVAKKSFKSEAMNISLNQSTNSLNNSMLSSNNSVFLKTVIDYKKETNLNLYNNEIAPLLINNIVDKIDNNYNKLVNNLKVSYTSNPNEVMIATVLRDQNLLKRNFRFIKNPKYKVLLDKQTILSEFEDTNKKIRADNHFASDNYYDNILNECLIDAANEILENERIYGQIGEPLPWSCRTRLINYKYIDNSVSKKNLTTKVRQEINNELNTKMGMFTENFENYEAEQLNYERERKLMNNITKELYEEEQGWKNMEVEETQVKIDISEFVLEQLFNEVVEILEHVQLSRRNPGLYQNKSIYACEDIPRLSIQTYTEPDDNINQ